MERNSILFAVHLCTNKSTLRTTCFCVAGGYGWRVFGAGWMLAKVLEGNGEESHFSMVYRGGQHPLICWDRQFYRELVRRFLDLLNVVAIVHVFTCYRLPSPNIWLLGLWRTADWKNGI